MSLNLYVMFLGQKISEKRKAMKLSMKELGLKTNIDQALISKYENNKRKISDAHARELSRVLELDLNDIRKEILVDKIVEMVQYEPNMDEILAVAEERARYLSSSSAFNVPEIDKELKEKLSIIDALKKEWNSKRPLDKTHLERMNEYFNVKYTFSSNQIEGNTLTYRETDLVVNKGITIDGKSMREHLEAINHAEAVNYLSEIISQKTPFDLRLIKQLHQLVLKSIDSKNAGVWRTVPVRISGSNHLPPEPYLLDGLMNDYITHYNRQKISMHPVILAAEMHERLVSIHPFIDGNGRTSRLVMNFVLLQNGYSVAILKGNLEARKEYYHALDRVQTNNEPELFYHLIANRVLESLQEHLEWVN